MKKMLIGIVLVLAIIFVIWAMNYNLGEKTDFDKENVKFIRAGCDPGLKLRGSVIHGILNQTWINENTLFVNGYIVSSCEGSTMRGSYEINKDNGELINITCKI